MSFTFLFTPFEYNGPRPFELAPGHLLDRATKHQTELIREGLEKYAGGTMVMARSIYEARWFTNDDGKGSHSEPRDEEDYCYWVINHEGISSHVHKLTDTLLLSESGIEAGWTFFTEPPFQGGPMLNPIQTASFFLQFPLAFSFPLVEVAERDLISVRDFVKPLQTAVADFSFIQHALHNFKTLFRLPRGELFSLLSYFALIESLVTHEAKGTDPTESITRQIRTKMKLLSERFAPPLRHPEFFPKLKDLSSDRLWNRLYGMRSKIAHGSSVSPKELDEMGGVESIRSFLLAASRALIRFAVKEPRMLQDLQDC